MHQARAEQPTQLSVYRLRKHSLHFLQEKKQWAKSPEDMSASAKIIHMFPYIEVTETAPKVLSEAVRVGTRVT